MENEAAIIELLTEIRNNQLKEIEYREQQLSMSRRARRDQNMSLALFGVFLASLVALLVWSGWQNGEESTEPDNARTAPIVPATQD